jgi:hypothetical protein
VLLALRLVARPRPRDGDGPFEFEGRRFWLLLDDLGLNVKADISKRPRKLALWLQGLSRLSSLVWGLCSSLRVISSSRTRGVGSVIFALLTSRFYRRPLP